jgi:hypothetical protein
MHRRLKSDAEAVRLGDHPTRWDREWIDERRQRADQAGAITSYGGSRHRSSSAHRSTVGSRGRGGRRSLFDGTGVLSSAGTPVAVVSRRVDEAEPEASAFLRESVLSFWDVTWRNPRLGQHAPEVGNHLRVDVLSARWMKHFGLCAEGDLDVAVVFFDRGPDRVEQGDHLSPVDVATCGMAKNLLERVAMVVTEI